MFFIHVENHIIIIVLLRKIYAMLFTETFLMLLEHNGGNEIVFRKGHKVEKIEKCGSKLWLCVPVQREVRTFFLMVKMVINYTQHFSLLCFPPFF